MCGIAGFFKLPNALARSASEEEAILKRMNAALVHRGPDDDGFLIRPPVYLAMRRLQIIDLASGTQPIFNETKSIAVVFNGEIYNYLELREELIKKGHHFDTHSDTEVLVHLYEEEGESFPKRLRGMYAFAIWDGDKRRLILGRDPFGIKPLYWGIFEGHLLFGSEIKAVIQHPAMTLRVNAFALDDYLTLMFIPAPHTIYEGLWKLEPGHLLIFNEEGGYRKVEFWAGLPPAIHCANNGFYSLDESLECLEAKISECVKIGLRSDVPLGVFLSGGLDSASVAYFAKKHKPDLKTFTVYFREKGFSEKEEALQTAKALQTDHTEILMELPQDTTQFVAKVFECFDEPFGDTSALPTYLLCQAARPFAKVCLSGDGGDELFGGYPTFLATQFFQYALRMPKWLRKDLLPALVGRLPTDMNRLSWDYRLKRFFSQAAFYEDWKQAHFAWRGAFSWMERASVYTQEFFVALSRRPPFDSVTRHFNRVAQAPFLDQLLHADRMTYLADEFLVKIDRMSMAHSLEVRPPLLDYELLEQSQRIPGRYKIKGLTTKWILRKLMKGRLPKKVLSLPKKGFSPPLGRWFSEKRLNNFMQDAIRSQAFQGMNIIQINYWERLLQEHTAGQVDHTRRLWVLLGLAFFVQRYAGSKAISV